MKFLKDKNSIEKIPDIFIPCLCFTLYCVLLYLVGNRINSTSEYNYFAETAQAFLKGCLNIEPPGSKHDLIFYDNKYYIYWPPAPALIYLPMVTLFGTNLPNNILSALFGAINVWLVLNIVQSLNSLFNLKLGSSVKNFTAIFWGLGTVHFYMSMSGEVWFISQIMAQTFLLSAILLSFKNNQLFLSGIFFSLAIYTRNNLIFSVLFILPLALWTNQKTNKLKSIILFGIPFALFTIFNFWYNYARFGNIFENGLKYHQMADYFHETFKTYGYFSWHYFPHNLHVEFFLPPQVQMSWPFIKYDPVGFGFIWASPVFLLLIPAGLVWLTNFFSSLNSSLSRQQHQFMTLCMISFTLIALVILLIMGTGWVQFAARYTLDFYIFLVIFVLFSWNLISKIKFINTIAVCLLLLSVIIQYNGVLLFYRTKF